MNEPASAKAPISIVLPAKNEATSLERLLPMIWEFAPNAEVLVIDDGSNDDTAEVARRHGAIVASHPYSLGNGAAVKTGLRTAKCDIVICMDADGQHRAQDIITLHNALTPGVDMVVGARTGDAQASLWRGIANRIYNRFAGWVVGHTIPDLTSGMRLIRRQKAMEFIHLLPNGFSYPTTLTIAFFRAGYIVKYENIAVEQRKGKSHISPMTDGLRFLLIIFKIGSLYSPLKIFFPTSLFLFLFGISYYLFTYLTEGRFTNMGALLLLTSLMTFLIGLVSEQITALMYQPRQKE